MSSRTNLQSPCPRTLSLGKFSRTLHSTDNMITITMRMNRDDKAIKWPRVRQNKEFADLHVVLEKIFCIPATYTAPVERVFSTSELFMQPHRTVLE